MFKKFFFTMISFKFMVVPFGTRNVVDHFPGGAKLGYTDYMIFGVRVARIQQTKPWD